VGIYCYPIKISRGLVMRTAPEIEKENKEGREEKFVGERNLLNTRVAITSTAEKLLVGGEEGGTTPAKMGGGGVW